MDRRFFLPLAFGLLLYSCTRGGGSSTEGPPDLAEGQVASLSPEDGAREVPVDAEIRIRFAEDMDPASISPANLLLHYGKTHVAAEVAYLPETREAQLRPFTSLVSQAQHRVEVGPGMRTQSGKAVGIFSWSFETEDILSPRIRFLSPAEDFFGAREDQAIEVEFDEPIDPANLEDILLFVTGPSGLVAGAQSLDATGTILSFQPAEPLRVVTDYTVGLTSAIRDLAGNSIAGKTWNFRTRTPLAGMVEPLESLESRAESPWVAANASGDALAAWRQVDPGRVYPSVFVRPYHGEEERWGKSSFWKQAIGPRPSTLPQPSPPGEI